MELYINSVGVVSSAGNNIDTDNIVLTSQDGSDGVLYASEPDYKKYISPMQLRRMSKAVRMGIAAASVAIDNAKLDNVDAMSVGTAMGCLADTEFFLGKLIDQEEQMLTPTAFIQSTHNTVAGQVALIKKCNGHNMTYVHRGHSFEHAMINAQLYINDHKGATILVGGIDELTKGSIEALRRGNVYRDESDNNGAIAGEGAMFFSVTGDKQDNSVLHVQDIYCIVEKDDTIASEKLSAFINKHLDGTDLVLFGMNGADDPHSVYSTIRNGALNDMPTAIFKHKAGDFPVASSLGLALLQQGILNEDMLLGNKPERCKTVLMVNHFMHYYSCWVVEYC